MNYPPSIEKIFFIGALIAGVGIYKTTQNRQKYNSFHFHFRLLDVNDINRYFREWKNEKLFQFSHSFMEA
jgi:hypothetical protein